MSKIKKLYNKCKAYCIVGVYYVDRFIYMHFREHEGMYSFVHKAISKDLQEELNQSLALRDRRKREGAYSSQIPTLSLDWEEYYE